MSLRLPALFAVVCAIAAQACTLPRLRSPGLDGAAREPLLVGSSGDYPPFSSLAPHGLWSGVDIDDIEQYARARGRDVVFIPFRWHDLSDHLRAGDFDLAVGGITVREDRMLLGGMTIATAWTEALILARRGTTLEEIDRASVAIAVNGGGHLERVARARFPSARIVTVTDNRALADPVRRGEASALVTDSAELDSVRSRLDGSAGAEWETVASLAQDRKAYWVGPDQEELARDLDTWLRTRGERAPPGLGPRSHSLTAARLADLVGRRLLLMPLVAAAKSATGEQIDDSVREQQVFARVRERAQSLALDPDRCEDLARAQMLAAKAVQRATRKSAAGAPPELATLRRAIDRLDLQLLNELAAAGGRTTADLDALASALEAELGLATQLAGIEPEHRVKIHSSLLALVSPNR